MAPTSAHFNSDSILAGLLAEASFPEGITLASTGTATGTLSQSFNLPSLPLNSNIYAEVSICVICGVEQAPYLRFCIPRVFHTKLPSHLVLLNLLLTPSFLFAFMQCSLLNYARGIDVFGLQTQLRSVFAPRIQSNIASNVNKAVAQPGRKPSSDSAAIPLLILKYIYPRFTQGEGAVVSNSLRTDDGRALTIREKTLRNRSDFSALAKSYLGPNVMEGKIVTWETLGDVNHPDREEHLEILCRVAAALQAKDAHLNCVEVACAALLVLENTAPVMKRSKGKKRARAENEDTDEDSCQDHTAKNKGGRRKRTVTTETETTTTNTTKRGGHRAVAATTTVPTPSASFQALEIELMDPVPPPLPSPLTGGPTFLGPALVGQQQSMSQDLSQCDLEMLGNLLACEFGEEAETPVSAGTAAAVESGMDMEAAAVMGTTPELPVLIPQQQTMDFGSSSLPYLLDALMEAQGGGPLMSLKLAASLTLAEGDEFANNIFLLSL